MTRSSSHSLFSELTNVDRRTIMAFFDCATKQDHNGSPAVKLRDERVNVFCRQFRIGVCVCVCVWCSPYVTDPSPLRWVRGEAVSSRAFQGEAGTEGRIEEDRGTRSGILPSSPPLVCLSQPRSVCFPPVSLLCAASPCLSSWPSLCAWLQRKCSGFTMWWSNEKRRGDSAVSAQRPHLLSFLCSLYLSPSPPLSHSLSLYLLRMHSAASAWAPVSVFTTSFA